MISVQLNDVRKDIISRIDVLDTSASLRDIYQDMILLQAMSNAMASSQNLDSVKMICGSTLDRCNVAFINTCQKAGDYISSLTISSKNLTKVDEAAGQIFGLLGRSLATISIVNAWHLQSLGYNITNSTNEDIANLTLTPFLTRIYSESMNRIMDQINTVVIRSDYTVSVTDSTTLQTLAGPG